MAQELLQNLNALIRQAVANGVAEHQPPARVQFKVPQYEGKGDVELYIEEMDALIEEEEWEDRIAVMKAREGLSGPARACGRFETWVEVADNLRLRFGLTQTEASARLASLRCRPNQSLAEYAEEVKRLVNVAYADTEVQPRLRLAMERFRMGLTDPGLQGHLLARQPDTLDAMIRASNEYLQVTRRNQPVTRGRGTDIPEEGPSDQEEDGTVEEVARQVTPTRGETPELAKMVRDLTQMVADLQAELKRSKEDPTPERQRGRERGRRQTGCWGCGKEGHLRRDCPNNPWRAGNGDRPRQ